jgi:hypothetical protein
VIISNGVVLRIPPAGAYPLLLDLDAIAPCIPGATLDPAASAEVRTGHVTVRFGPMSFTYGGQVRITSTDAAARRAVLEARGSEVSGEGSATGIITMSVEPHDAGSRVLVESDLQLSGAAAQLGRAMIEDFAEAMLEDFAGCLARKIDQPAAAGAAPARPAAAPAAPIRARVMLWRVLRNRLRRLLGRRGKDN